MRPERAAVRRGDRLLVHIARVELVLGDLTAIDKLLVLNTARENTLHDHARRAEGRHP